MMLINTNRDCKTPKRLSLFSSLIVILALCSPSLNAQTEALNKCKAIKDSNKRLACYDALQAQTKSENAEDKNSSVNSEQKLDEIDRRAQALMLKANSSETPFSSNTARISSGGPDISDRQENNKMDEFGAQASSDDSSKIVGDELFSTVTGVKRDIRDYATFTLSNGQIWRQTEGSTLRIGSGDEVTIEKGVLSSYYLSKPGNNRQVRVARVK